MRNMEDAVEMMERQNSAWEVSSYDISQTNTYREWADKNVKEFKVRKEGKLTEAIFSDAKNVHFAFIRPPKALMYDCLNELGMDTKDTIERQVCTHRTFGGFIVYGERYVGKQRTDKKWKEFVESVTTKKEY